LFATQSRQILKVALPPLGVYEPTASAMLIDGKVNCSEVKPKTPLYAAFTPPVHVPCTSSGTSLAASGSHETQAPSKIGRDDISEK